MNIEHIVARIENLEDKILIEKAYKFADYKLSGKYYIDGGTLISHILEVTNTLIDFKADSLTLISSIVFETFNCGVSKEDIEKEFNTNVATIAFGVSKINSLTITNDNEKKASYLNELSPDSPEDVRILFIELANRFYNMKNIGDLPVVKQQDIARETLDMLIPTAHRLGLNFIKSKLEDLCLFYLSPHSYNEILNKLNATPDMLSTYLNSIKKDISNLLMENNIDCIIKGRVKSIYSIYTKLMNGKSWEEIYDILALRIIVEDKSQCRKLIELIHSKYMFLPSRFKDYISNPKENMYQSLHTTIVGEDNRFYEIQIRTNEMNNTAEVGSASHMLYKKLKNKKNKF